MSVASTAAARSCHGRSIWLVLSAALLVLFFSTTSNLVDAAAGTPPSYALLTTNAGCWLPDSTNEVMFAADAADAPFEFAKAFCEARGGALANANVSSTTSATWTGVMRSESPAAWVRLSGDPFPADWGIANATVDPLRPCYTGAGQPVTCNDTSVQARAVCQRPVAPSASEWVRWPSGASATLAAAYVPAFVTRAQATAVCTSIGADLGYVPDAAIAQQAMLAHQSGNFTVLNVSGAGAAGTGACGASGSATYRGLWTSYTSGAFANQGTYTGAGVPAPTSIDAAGGAGVVLLYNESATPKFVSAGGGRAAVLCTRILTSVSLQLSASSFVLGSGATPTIGITIGRAVPTGETLRVYIQSSVPTVAFPTQWHVDFTSSSGLSKTVVTGALSGGTASFSASVDAGYANFARTPTWTGGQDLSIVVPAAASIAGTRIMTFYPGQAFTFAMALSAPVADATVYFDPPASACFTFGPVRFPTGETYATFVVTAKATCAVANYLYTPHASSGKTITAPLPLRLTVTAVVTVAPSYSLYDGSAEHAILYDGGAVETPETVTLTPSANVPVPVHVDVSTNCSSNVDMTPKQTTWGTGTSNAVVFTMFTRGWLATPEIFCELRFVCNETTAVSCPPNRILHVRQRITLDIEYFPTYYDRGGTRKMSIYSPRWWATPGRSGAIFGVSFSGAGLSVNPAIKIVDATIGSRRWVADINTPTDTSADTTGTVSITIDTTGTNNWKAFRRPADQKLFNVEYVLIDADGGREFQLQPINATAYGGEDLHMRVCVRTANKATISHTIEALGFNGDDFKDTNETANDPANKAIQPNEYIDSAIADFSYWPYSSALGAATASGNPGWRFQGGTPSLYFGRNIIMMPSWPAKKTATGGLTAVTELTDSAPLSVPITPTVELAPGTTLVVDGTKSGSHISVSPSQLTWTHPEPLVPKNFVISVNSNGGAATFNPRQAGFSSVRYTAGAELFSHEFQRARVTKTMTATTATTTVPAFSDAGTAVVVTYASGSLSGGDVVWCTPAILDRHVNYTMSAPLASGGPQDGFLRFDNNEESKDVAFTIFAAPAGTTLRFGTSFIATTETQKWVMAVTEDSVTVTPPTFLTIERVGSTSLVAPLADISLNISLSRTGALSANATVNLTKSGVASTLPTSVVLTPAQGWFVVTLSPSTPGSVSVLARAPTGIGLTVVNASIHLGFVAAIAPAVSGMPSDAFDGPTSRGFTVSMPLVYSGDSLTLTPRHDGTTAPSAIVTTPTDRTVTPSTLSGAFTFDVAAPIRENITVGVTGGPAGFYADTVTTPFVFARRRMAAGFDDVPASMYAGVANEQRVRLSVGNPLTGVTTFAIEAQGAPSSIFSPQTFTCSPSSRCDIVWVAIRGHSSGGNISFVAVPSSPNYHVNSSTQRVEIIPLDRISVTLDSHELYGFADYIALNTTLIDPLSTTGFKLDVTPTFNDTLESSPVKASFVFAGTETWLGNVSLGSAFNMTNVTHSQPEYVSFNVTPSQNRQNFYAYPLTESIRVFPQKTVALEDSLPLNSIFVGESNAKAFGVRLSSAPKPDRELIVSVSVANASNATAVVVSPSHLTFNSTTPLLQSVTVTASSSCTFNLVLVELSNSTAVEFRSFDNFANVSVTAYDTVPVVVTQIPASVNVLRPNAVHALRIVTDAPRLLVGENVTVVLTAAPSGLVQITTPHVFVNSDGVTETWANITAVPTVSAPTAVDINISMLAPTSFGPLTLRTLNFTVAPLLNITVVSERELMHIGAPPDTYKVHVSVPAPGNDYTAWTARTGLTMAITMCDFYGNFRVGTTANDPVITSFDFSASVVNVTLDIKPENRGRAPCWLNFTMPAAPAMEAEYRSTAASFNIEVNRTSQVVMTPTPLEIYDGGQISFDAVAGPADLYGQCNGGETVNATIAPQTPFNATVSTNAFGISSLVPFNFSRSIVIGPQNVTSQQNVQLRSSREGSTCFAITPDAGSSPSIAVHPPDVVRVFNLPRFCYLETDLPIQIGVLPTIAIPTDANTIVVRLQAHGPPGAVNISGPNITNAMPGSANTSAWFLTFATPAKGQDLRIDANITGKFATEGVPAFFFTSRGVGDAYVAFRGATHIGGSNETTVKDLLTPEYFSNSSIVAAFLTNGTTTDTDGGLSLFGNETFSFVLHYELNTTATITPIYDNETITLVSERLDTTTANYTRTFVFRCAKTTLNATRTANLGTPTFDITHISVRIDQTVNLFARPAPIPVKVRPRTLITLTQPPTAIRINPANRLVMDLAIDTPPTREPVNVTFTVQNASALMITPSFLVWQFGQRSAQNITFQGVIPNDGVFVNVAISSEEFQKPPELSNYFVRVLPLGTVHISNARSRLFVDQSAVLSLTPDDAPIAHPLNVLVSYPAQTEAVSFDYSIAGLLAWPLGSANVSRSFELFANTPTNGAFHPMNYTLNSTEFDKIECDGCQTLRIIANSEPAVVGGGADLVTRIIFVGGTYSFQLQVPSCEGTTISAVPELVDAPSAVVFNPAQLEWTCDPVTKTGAPISVNVTGLPKAGGGDPTTRASTIELRVTERLAGAPDQQRPVALSAFILEVRAPRDIAVNYVGPQYFGSPMPISVVLPRLPAAGELRFRVTPTLAFSFNVSQPIVWQTALSGGKEADLARVAYFEQTDYTAPQSNVMLAFSLEGPAKDEYTIPAPSTVTIATKRPVAINARLSSTPRIYRGIWNQAEISLADKPDDGTTFVLGFAAQQLDVQAGQSAGVIEFEPTSISFTSGTLNSTLPFRFRTSTPGLYTILFATPPGSVPLAKFNKTVNAPTLTAFRVQESIRPSVTAVPNDVQFMLERNAQTFQVKLPSPPADDQSLYATPRLVFAGDQKGLVVEFKPTSAEFSLATVTGTESRFSIFSKNRLELPANDTVGPFEVWMDFASNRTSLHFNTTSLLVGRLTFVPLHFVLPPVQREYRVYVGQQLRPPIPVVFSGRPPAYASAQAEYAVALSVPASEATNDAAFAVTPSQITVGKEGNVVAGAFEARALAVSAADSPFTLRIASETKLDLAPSFDTLRTREVPITVHVLALYEPALVHKATTEPIANTVPIFVGEANTAEVDFLLSEWVAEDAATTSIKVNASFEPEGYISIPADAQEFYITQPIVPFRKTIRITGLASTSNFTGGEPLPRLVFTLSGSERVTRTVSIELSIYELHGFDVTDAPIEIFAGEKNAQTFTVAPSVVPQQSLSLVARPNCPQLTTVSVTGRPATWNNTKLPTTFRIAGTLDASVIQQDCEIPIRQPEGAASPRFVDIATQLRVTFIPAPEMTLRLTDSTLAAGTTTISADYFRSRGVQFRLYLEHTTFVDEGNITLALDDALAAINISSTVNGTEVPTSFHGLFSEGKATVEKSLNEQQSILTVTLNKAPDYTTFVGETLRFALQPHGLTNGTVPNPDPTKSVPTLTIEPDTRAPPARTERQALEATTFSAAAVSGLASLASATQVARVLAVGSMSDCPSQNWRQVQDDMPIYFAPIPLSIGPHDDALGGYAGAAVSNCAVCVACIVVHYLIARGLYKLKGSGHDFRMVQSTVHFPSLGAFPILLLYQVTLTAACLLLLYSTWAIFKVIGSIVFVVCAIAIPAGLVQIYNKTQMLEYTPPQRRGIRDWLFERGSYTHPADETWVNRFNLPFYQLRGEARWYCLFDLGIITCLGLVTAVQPRSGKDCIVRTGAAMLIFLLQFVVLALVQPFSSRFDNLFFIAGYLVQLAAMGVILYADINDTDFEAAYELSGRILLGFAVMLALKAIVDWWRLALSGLSVCAVLDPVAERNFKSAGASPTSGRDDVGTFFGGEKRREMEEGLLDAPKRRLEDVPIADVTCATRSAGTGETLVGFRRSMDRSVAALSGDACVVGTASVHRTDYGGEDMGDDEDDYFALARSNRAAEDRQTGGGLHQSPRQKPPGRLSQAQFDAL